MATLMLESGADIRFIQQMLGHARICRTTQIYTHVSIRMLQQIHAATHPGSKAGARSRAARHGQTAARRDCWRRWQPRRQTTKNHAAKGKKNEGIIVSMATIHISEADAARDFAGLMARVRAGAEIVIESDTHAGGRPARGESRPAAPSPSASHWRRSTKSKPAKLHRSIRTSPPMWKRSSATVSRWNPAGMGLILDSSVVIAAERRGQTPGKSLEQIKARARRDRRRPLGRDHRWS